MRQLYIYSLFALMALVVIGCDAESGGVFSDDTTEEYQLYDYYVDSYGNEGVVAYISTSTYSDSKYIIVISSDEAYLPWGPMDEVVYLADSVSISDSYNKTFGVAMLQAMSARGINRYPAQAWCNRKNHEELPRGGSWKLPTYLEWQLCMNNTEKLNAALVGIGGELLDMDHLYWTCIEDHEGLFKSSDPNHLGYDNQNKVIVVTPEPLWTKRVKKRSSYVRAIKYVYYKYD